VSPPSEHPRPPASPSEDTPGAHASSSPREEAIDALPVLAQEAAALGTRPVDATVTRPSPALVIPAVQAAAAAAGGFVAGAAVVGLVHRHRRRAALERVRHGGRGVSRSRAGGRAAARAGELVQIVGSRSLLVDVHLLGER
jgi:hypothetical protein